jgi:multidrug transporter EmrE-like cation transporter
MLGWLVLLAGIALEVLGTVLLRGIEHVSAGVTFVLAASAILASLALFALAIRTLPLAIAYTAWAGLGIATIVAVDAIAFDQPVGAVKLVSILLVVAGVIGLTLAGPPAV